MSKPHWNSERDAGVLLVLMGLTVESPHQLVISPSRHSVALSVDQPTNRDLTVPHELVSSLFTKRQRTQHQTMTNDIICSNWLRSKRSLTQKGQWLHATEVHLADQHVYARKKEEHYDGQWHGTQCSLHHNVSFNFQCQTSVTYYLKVLIV